MATLATVTVDCEKDVETPAVLLINSSEKSERKAQEWSKIVKSSHLVKEFRTAPIYCIIIHL